MKNKWKSIYSIIAIGIFAALAAGSLGPDKSTNTTVAISNCKSKPGFTGKLNIYVSVEDDEVNEIAASGQLYIVHQKVRPDTTCTFDVVLNTVADIQILQDETYTYDGPAFTHDNSEDLFRVELRINGSTEYGPYDEVKVIKYSQQSIQFNAVVHKYHNL